MAEGRAFTWDDVIINESTFTLIDEGDYNFRVTKVERGHHDGGSAKLPPCPKVTLTLAILNEDGRELTTLTHTICLHSSVEGLISSFFLSVGLKKHGEPVRLSEFNKAAGKTGRCHVFIDEWTNGKGEDKKNNKIKYFIDSIPVQTAQSAPAQQFAPTQGAQQFAPQQNTPAQQSFGGWGNGSGGTGWTAR